MALLDQLVKVSKALATGVQSVIAEQDPRLAQEVDLPQRQRFLELVARGFDTFVHGLARATREADTAGGSASSASSPQLGHSSSGRIRLGPQDPAAAAAEAAEAAQREDDEAYAAKFARLFIDMGGIFPKLAQVLSLRPDLIKNERVLRRLRQVQEECKSRPFDECCAQVAAESAPFREGRYELREWVDYMHAGSVAQVVPFVAAGSTPPPTAGAAGANAAPLEEAEPPSGVMKLTWTESLELMKVDFRLLRFQLRLMKQSGQLARPGAAGGGRLPGLSPSHLRLLEEVWSVMVGLEDEVLQEFDLCHEARCQERGAVVLEGLLGPGGSSCDWLEAWRDRALQAALRPAGPQVSTKAVETWRATGGEASRPGWLQRMARRALAGRAAADGLAAGEEHVGRLREALRHLRVQVPAIHTELSGPRVLGMALAKGRSLKQVLDVALQQDDLSAEAEGASQKAAAWFAVLLLFVIVPIWGKMLLVVGCCHADPHPGNFKVDGIPGLEDVVPPRPARRRRWLPCTSASSAVEEPVARSGLVLSVLDWGSCVDLEDSVRETLCRLLLGLHELRWSQRRLAEAPEDEVAKATEARAEAAVATCIRCLGVGVDASEDQDGFLAALGLALFDPAVASSHPKLHGSGVQELGRRFPVGSSVGKVLRVIAILVGLCRELESRANAEAKSRLEAAGGAGGAAAAAASGRDRPFVELFLVELWRPFAEEGLSGA